MKTAMTSIVSGFVLGMGVLWGAEAGARAGGSASDSASETEQPVLTSVTAEGTNLVAVARVPRGIKAVTLEGRRRIGVGTWAPRAVARLDGSGGEVTLRVPMSSDVELLRVRADAREALPTFFYHGTNRFAEASGVVDYGAGPSPGRGYTGDLIQFVPVQTSVPIVGGADASPPRVVVESDIWKVSGTALYFFNQYRGLQVIDISDPDSPSIRGTFDLTAAGEQMYLIDTNYAVLLTHGCGWNGNNGNSVLIIDVTSTNLNEVASLPVDGQIAESRLVGTVLYVASQLSRPLNGDPNRGWEWGTMVSSFDLSNPAQPVARQQLWYPSAYSSVVSATDHFFFLSTQTNSWWQSVVQVIDISAPDGTMLNRGVVQPAGQVTDKFKLNLNGDTFTVISEAWSNATRWTPTLETFSLADPDAPQKLGSVTFASGEQLHATRFDGNRVYVVTFLRTDPLWVVDLSNPSTPTVTGKLEVPGWSTYIQPLGDRLVTVGVQVSNNWRVAVSLFDVSNPAQPAVLSQVPIGSNSSWSEANTDEKAFGVFPDAGLILVPYQGFTTNGYATAVQLIDLNPNSLALRGVIQRRCQPRRTTVYDGRILSLSSGELLSVDATDRDAPAIMADLELTWPVDQVFLEGDFLIEIASGRDWSNQGGASLHITSAANPETALQGYSLTNLPVLGATVRDHRLYLVQGPLTWYLPPLWSLLPSLPGDTKPTVTNLPVFSFSVFDLANLPAVSRLGQTSLDADVVGWNSSYQALWPKPGLLVWSGGAPGYPYLTTLPSPINRWSDGWHPWWGSSGNSSELLAFDVSSNAAPRFLSATNMISTNRWGFSAPVATNGLVYLSHTISDSYITGTNYWTNQQAIYVSVTNDITVTNVITKYVYQQVTTVTPGEAYTTAGVNRLPGWSTNTTAAANVAAGATHNLALAPDGTLSAWGANTSGQLGDGTRSNRALPGIVPGLTNLASAAGGGGHTLAIRADGTVWAWGDDLLGQLGDGASVISTNGEPPMPVLFQAWPVPVSGPSNVVAVAAGFSHSLALDADGTAWAWGDNQFGQLGDGTQMGRNRPSVIHGLSRVTAITAGYFHSLALDQTGTVWAWGRNESGQLGDGTTTDRAQPVTVIGLTNIKALFAGLRHSLALDTAGTVWAWGANESGQLGDGTTSPHFHPVRVAGLDGVTTLAAGGAFNLALRGDEDVRVWGANSFRQLGTGGPGDCLQPIAISGLRDVLAVAAGANHSLVLRRDGTLWAWGDDSLNQASGAILASITNAVTITNVVMQPLLTNVTNVTTVRPVNGLWRYVTVTNSSPIVVYYQRSFLDVVDYADPENPTIREPVNIPGALQGIGYGGALIYTAGQHWSTNYAANAVQWLDASAYDGVSAHLVDSLAAATNWWRPPLLVQDTNIFIGHLAGSTNESNTLQLWTVPDTGQFTEVSSTKLNTGPNALAAVGNLLAVQEYDSSLELFYNAGPAGLVNVGTWKPDDCIGYNLGNADGGLGWGLFLARGDYGVKFISLTRSGASASGSPAP